MRLQRVSTVATALVLSLAFPESARSGDNNAIAGTIAVAAMGALVCSAVALGVDHSEGTDEYERKGWLINLAGTYAIPTFEQEAEDDLSSALGVKVGFSADESLGGNGGFGYRCHRFFSTEAEIERVVEFQTEASLPGLSTVATADLEPLTFTTNFKGYFPLGRFQPFALAGAGLMSTRVKVNVPGALGPSFSDDAKGITLRFGAGLDFYATKHIVLDVGADYVFPLGDVKDLDYISVGWGIQYRF